MVYDELFASVVSTLETLDLSVWTDLLTFAREYHPHDDDTVPELHSD